MFDPFAYQRRLVAATLGVATTAQRATEIATASQDVITRRSQIMAHAARSPLAGDYAELGRMVPEKLEAFSRAGTAVANDWWTIQISVFNEARHLWRQAMKGRAPTVAEYSATAARNAEFLLRTFEQLGEMSGAALNPIHATATDNAKRLKQATHWKGR